ncbi:MAG: alpha/beta hydrolase [Isosphaeraceae bacterium]
MTDDRLRHSTVTANGVRLHLVEAGPKDGPPVVLLHGFPEFWYGWRHQIGPLAEAGYRVIAPDQRGYGESEKPRGVSAYGLDTLSEDVAGLIAALGVPSAAVVGHDWGGIVAWWLAVRRPELVSRLVVLNAPHPMAMRRRIATSPRQLFKSWYLFYFQIPWLPETLLGLRNWKALADSLRSTSRPGTFSDDELDRYKSAWSRPGAMTAMIHWYRAAMRVPPAPREDVRVHVPTRILWGANDRFIERSMAEISLGYCDQGCLEVIEEATHWVQHEEPERVNRSMLEFLRDDGTRAS